MTEFKFGTGRLRFTKLLSAFTIGFGGATHIHCTRPVIELKNPVSLIDRKIAIQPSKCRGVQDPLQNR